MDSQLFKKIYRIIGRIVKINKAIWVVFDSGFLDGPFVFLSKKKAKETLELWKKEDGLDKYGVANVYLGPFKYMLEEKR